MKTTTVLCPVNFSATSRAAFLEACEIAREDGARLVLLHVYQAFLPMMPELPIIPAEVLKEDVAQREQQLERWRVDAREHGVGAVEVEMVQGVPWDSIVTSARTWGCQLIAMGTHGRTGLRHVLIGSVAEKVARHAPCSVLVVRPRAVAA